MSMFQKHIHKVKFYPSADDSTQALLVMLVTNIMSAFSLNHTPSMPRPFAFYYAPMHPKSENNYGFCFSVQKNPSSHLISITLPLCPAHSLSITHPTKMVPICHLSAYIFFQNSSVHSNLKQTKKWS